MRFVRKEDLKALKQVLDSIDLFPSEMLDEMIDEYLSNPNSEDIWFTKIIDNQPVSIGYCAPEQLTKGTFNLYAIGVRKDLQGNGIGGEMMTFLEAHLKALGHRILIVDTSGTQEFELTRKFYFDRNYTHEATIRDFWGEGDDKMTFWKRL